MTDQSRRNARSAAKVAAAPRPIFGAPLTFRASFLLTILFDFSLIVLAVTFGVLVSGT